MSRFLQRLKWAAIAALVLLVLMPLLAMVALVALELALSGWRIKR